MRVWLPVAKRTASALDAALDRRRGRQGFDSVTTDIREDGCSALGEVPVSVHTATKRQRHRPVRQLSDGT
jgi:hypothetical protein